MLWLRTWGQVAEGVNTVKVVKKKADELGVYMPLVSGLHAVLFEGCAIAEVVKGSDVGGAGVRYRLS